MSLLLKTALKTVKEAIERDGSPVIYLHDPESGQPFAVLVTEPPIGGEDRWLNEAAEAGMEEKGWDPMNHSHIEGTEDE